MRIVIFIAIWACLGLMQAANAQESAKRKDTLIIQISGKNQLHIMGNSMKEISKYDRADSLKDLFAADYKKALENGTIANSIHRIHYLVGKEGQRRMKAANDAYTEEPFNLEAEKKRFEFNLPAIHYTIYDLAKDIEMHFYMEDSSGINQLENFHISNAIKMLSESKKEIKNNYRLNFERDGLSYKINERVGKRQFEVGIRPILGAMLLGTYISPVAGMDVGFSFSNKYKEPKMRISYLLSSSILYNNGVFNIDNATETVMNEISFSLNSSRSKKERWFGLHGGVMSNLEIYGFPKSAQKFGFHIPVGDYIIYSVDFISNKRTTFSNMFQVDPNEKSIYSMSIRAWF